MNWKTKLLISFLICSACKNDKVNNGAILDIETNKTTSKYLIEAEDLTEKIDSPNIKIVDFRKPEQYKKEHITGALNIWRTNIEDTTYSYGGMMARKEQIESVLGNLGISETDTLIVYDDKGLCDSARLWWVLQNYDFDNIMLLHGGLKRWKELQGNVNANLPTIERTTFRLSDNPSFKYYISKEEIFNKLEGKATIIDTRSENEYYGKRQKMGALKAGRIPNSKNIDWTMAINFEGDKKFRSIDQLNKVYHEFASDTNDIIVYCHSGVRSAHTTFVLTQLLGLENVRNYDGSWTEWSHNKDLPYIKDSITTLFD